jgi:hypothetical protein
MFLAVGTDCVKYLGAMSHSNLHLHHHVDYIYIFSCIKFASSLHIYFSVYSRRQYLHAFFFVIFTRAKSTVAHIVSLRGLNQIGDFSTFIESNALRLSPSSNASQLQTTSVDFLNFLTNTHFTWRHAVA